MANHLIILFDDDVQFRISAEFAASCKPHFFVDIQRHCFLAVAMQYGFRRSVVDVEVSGDLK